MNIEKIKIPETEDTKELADMRLNNSPDSFRNIRFG